MVMTAPVLRVDRAAISHTADGATILDDPGCPWLVSVWPATHRGRAHITRLTVEAREPQAAITAARLARLPTDQLLYVASRDLWEQAAPNEAHYRMLAVPRGLGDDAGHWQRVRVVAAWAVAENRPGGPARAIADFWGISLRPTAYRWLQQARRETT